MHVRKQSRPNWCVKNLNRKVFVNTTKHNLRALGITGNIGIWLFLFITDRSHFVRLPGGISEDHPVLSGVVVVVLLRSGHGSSQSRFSSSR